MEIKNGNSYLGFRVRGLGSPRLLAPLPVIQPPPSEAWMLLSMLKLIAESMLVYEHSWKGPTISKGRGLYEECLNVSTGACRQHTRFSCKGWWTRGASNPQDSTVLNWPEAGAAVALTLSYKHLIKGLEYKDPGRYFPISLLLYSWGSLFGVPIQVPLS